MLSVVIPTFRKPELLERTLGALASQLAGEDVEIVVVDDGSADDHTPQVLRRWRDQVPLVEAGSAVNEGRARARNRGWRAAQGRWVLFLDDDIVLREGSLRAHIEAQTRREAVYLGTVVTAPAIVDSPLFAYLDSRGVAKLPPGAPVPARYLLTQNVSIPRASLATIGGFDEDFGAYGFEDMELGFRLEDRCGLEFWSMPGAVGEHVHHHTLEEYLHKKEICGRETLPRLVELHPGRAGEMRLDLLPGIGASRATNHRLFSGLLRLSWAWGGEAVARSLVRVPNPWLPARARHRLYDYLVFASYARGLGSRAPASAAE